MICSRRIFVSATISASLSPLLAQELPKAGNLQRVDAKYTCFITQHRFDKPQLPVVVDGKTYYGCCEMCKAKLTNDPASRFAIDPVSGKKVDKATAVIGADSNGKIYFFENEKDLEDFHQPAASK
jgi:YHS domain-containing protein